MAAFNEGPYLYLLTECIMGGELFTYLQVCTMLMLMSQVELGLVSVCCTQPQAHKLGQDCPE